jgi:phospholipase/lecithinase/hemolysin
MKRRLVGFAAGVACVIMSAGAQAFSNLYVFGDSLSDSGNNALALPPGAITPVPISGNDFVPTFPYASTHYTNDSVWAQSFAQALGLQANPSLAGGTDFAFGGARTSGTSPVPTLVQQTAGFLAANPHIPADGLYIVEGGGNNARDALMAIAAKPSDLVQIIKNTAEGYAEDVSGIVHSLEKAGARDIVVWDVPDLGKAPSLLSQGAQASFLGTVVALSMNVALDVAIKKDPNVTLFDTFGIVDDITTHPGKFGLTNVTDACAQFTNCDPSKFFFWDGIHPASAGHEIFSEAMLQLVPEPSTYAAVIMGFMACVVLLRGRIKRMGY